jgi:transcriptional regulator with XRE-family HTH domain
VAALAAASGLTKGFISQVERDLARPSLKSLGRIAASLGLSPQALIADEALDHPERAPQDVPPRRFRLSSQPIDAPGSQLQILASGTLTITSSAKLAPGAHLSCSGQDNRHAQGVLVVLGGEGLLETVEHEIELQRGDIVSWNASASYRVSSVGAVPLDLALIFESGAPMPAVSETVHDHYANLRAASNRAVSSEAPLRLVALRQQARARAGL